MDTIILAVVFYYFLCDLSNKLGSIFQNPVPSVPILFLYFLRIMCRTYTCNIAQYFYTTNQPVNKETKTKFNLSKRFLFNNSTILLELLVCYSLEALLPINTIFPEGNKIDINLYNL